MGRPRSLTEGNIFSSLIRFAVPVLFTLFLQALYGGVDLLVVGQFAQTADVSGVATGSMLLQTVTMVVTGLSMGITILVGERIGPAGAGGCGPRHRRRHLPVRLLRCPAHCRPGGWSRGTGPAHARA